MKKNLILIIILWIQVGLTFGQEKIEMRYENGIYTIPCIVNDLRLRFIFDTGAANVSISAMEAGFMLKNGYLQESDFINSELCLLADGSIAENAVINIRELKIGSITLKNVKAHVVINTNAPLLLGQSAISQFGKWSIDSNFLYLGSESKDSPCNNLTEEEHYKFAKEYENKGNMDEAYQHLKEICNNGDYGKDLVMFVLRNNYKDGYKLASKLCLDMCLSGDEQMIFHMFHNHSLLQPKNKKERLEFYQILSKSCSPIFYGYLALAYYYGCSEEPIIAKEYISYLNNATLQIESYISKTTDFIVSKEDLKHHLSRIYMELGDVYYNKYKNLYEPIFDKGKAFICYEKAAQLSTYGMWKYGNALYKDKEADGATKSKAIHWLTKAAEANIDYVHTLIDAYYYGDVVPKNHEKAIEYCNHLLEQNNADYKYTADKYLGFIYYENEEYDKAFKHLRDACKYIDIMRQEKGIFTYTSGTFQKLGDCYYFGWGTSVNYVKAYEQYLKEWKKYKDNLHCLYNIAYMTQHGLGVQQNEISAFELYQEGANMGDVYCQVELAWCYYAELGTSEDFSKAIFWSKKAIENDSTMASAHLLLGYIYESKYTCNYDISKAISCFDAASTNGSAQASYELGTIYEYGVEPNVQRNYKLAKKYYSLAVEQGHSEAKEKLRLFE